MTIEEVTHKRNVLVGMKFDSCSRELLGWAVFKVAEPGDSVVAVHVRRNSGNAPRGKLLLDSHIQTYESICSLKKVDLTGQICTGNSVRRSLVREAKNHSSAVLILGISNPNVLWGWNSMARYCSKRLPPTTDVLAIHNGRIVFRRFNSSQLLEGRTRHGDLKPSLSLTSSPIAPSEFGDSELGSVRSSFEVLTENGSGDSKDEIIRRGRRSESCLALDQKPGWPLLRRAVSADADTRELSVVQWALSLPNRFENRLESLSEELKGEAMGERSFLQLGEIGKRLEILLQGKSSSSCCKWLSYELLQTATCKFHSENLVGKGGWNQVYKGTFQDEKLVAVKIRKSSSPEAREDFVQELEIISSLKHNNITPLIGICIRDFDLISVYHFLPNGSLEENLHGKNNEKSPLSWDVRFRIAVKIAEALNYIHNETSRPVIHMDVKSANILLTDELEPQLSDFGLAIWGPTASSFVTQPDVVGTFGYLAPEYFMYGKVSDKIDVYSFGVVLLELITGREAIISSENSKAQLSLVMWANQILECGNPKDLLDPSLNGEFDDVQFRRMVIAAKLCTTRAARLRPKMSEVLKLLGEEEYVAKCVIPQHKDEADDVDSYDDEVYPESSPHLHLNLAFLDVDIDSTSHSDQGSCLTWEDYLKGRWSRSSSFNH
ncbi:Protein kinase STUNTED [Linum grandiflorum]